MGQGSDIAVDTAMAVSYTHLDVYKRQALRELGFDYVFDTDFAADLTIMEEGSEILNRHPHARNRLGKQINNDDVEGKRR